MPRASGRTRRGHDARREVASPDGVVSFCMKRTACGVHVERTHRVDGSAVVAHSALFATLGEFHRFCEQDELRFNYPLTYQQIRREFNDLFQVDS